MDVANAALPRFIEAYHAHAPLQSAMSVLEPFITGSGEADSKPSGTNKGDRKSYCFVYTTYSFCNPPYLLIPIDIVYILVVK
jgi:hypothetical protein